MGYPAQQDVFFDLHEARPGILGDHRHLPGKCLQVHLPDVPSLQQDLPLYGFKHPGDGSNEGGLAGAVGADHPQKLSPAHLEAHILQKELGFDGIITGVEIDPKAIELGSTFFGLNKVRNLRIEICDAFDFVFKEQQKYDLIVVDLFIDHHIPEKFDQPDFMAQLDRLLEKGGMLLYNRINQSFKDKNRIELFRKTCDNVFKKAELVEEFNIQSNNIIFHVKK